MNASSIATPSPIRTPSEGPYSLSERINIATRPVHSTLNRLILARLPLALPPHTTNSSTYVSGLLHVAPIYITFESLWQSFLDAPSLPTNLAQAQSFPFDKQDTSKPPSEPRAMPLMTPPDSPLPKSAQVCPRTKFLLSHLLLPGLLRSQRLRNDIRVLSGTPAQEIEQQLAVVALRGRLADFIAHTKCSVGAKPHVLLAYAWVLYMALFSGGRHLRRALKEAGGVGPNFWERDPSPVRPYSITNPDSLPPTRRRCTTQSSTEPEPTVRHSARSRRSNSHNDTAGLVPGMGFFNFAGQEDGEDIKTLFKMRIAEAEVLLSAGEKDDIITEAEHIFTFMIDLISDLDLVMGTRSSNPSHEPKVSRDSIDLAHERISLASTMHEKLDTAQSTYLSVVTEHYRSLAQMVSRRFAAGVGESQSCPASSVTFSKRVDVHIPALEGRVLQSRMLPVAAWFLTAVMVFVAWQMVV